MAELLPVIKASFYDSNGEPLSGGKLYSYEAGTTTPKATYTNRAGNVANTNPVILDADGQADVWLGEGFYKFTLENSAGDLQYTEDNIASPQIGALESAFWRGVVYITFAESPYTITTSDNGKLISVDSSGGAVSVILPEISSLTLPFNVGVKRSTGSGLVTTTRSGTDTINGSTSKSFSLVGMGCQFIGTNTTSPDKWETNDFLDFYDGVVTPVKFASESLPISGVMNFGLSSSVATNALTVALKDAVGNNPSSTSPVRASFRNATATTGTKSSVDITAALSITVPSSATLGHVSAKNQYVWVYLINDGGTIDIGVSNSVFDDGSLQSSTLISSGSTSATVLYSSSSHIGAKPVRLIGRLLVNEATAGTWATAATEIVINPTPRVNLSEWTSYTPTFTSCGTVAATAFWYRRSGNMMEIRGTVTIGTPTSTLWSMTLPSGFSLDVNYLSPNNNTTANKGMQVGWITADGVAGSYTLLTAPGTSLTLLYDGNLQSGGTPLVPQSTNTGLTVGGLMTITNCAVPISGWTTYGP